MAIRTIPERDYRLVSTYKTYTPLDDDAIEEKVEQAWWSPDIPRDQLKALMQRTNRYGLLDFGLWIILLGVSGYLAWISWGTWWAILAFFIYGTLYSSSDARWHECGHGTVFRTRWLNELFYHISSFMTIREANLWRWSHARHHTNTYLVGYDPEIQVQRPADLLIFAIDFFFLRGVLEVQRVIRHAAGQIGDDVRSFVPASELPKVVWMSRIYLAIVAAFGVWAVAVGSFLPMMFVWLPRFYGAFVEQMLAVTQHAGLGEDTYDHRQNTRTIYLNPVFRYLYMNMNYHIEHHVIPMVPYHALADLHELMKSQTPPPYRSLWQAYKEMIPALYKQATQDPNFYIKRPIPDAGTTVEAFDIPIGGVVTSSSALRDEPVANVRDGASVPAESVDTSIEEIPTATAANTDAEESSWIEVCNVSDIEVEDVLGFDYNGRTYAIYRLGSHAFFASDGLCTHEETELAAGFVFDGCIECPLHLGRFDIETGKALSAPVTEDLRTYPVELRGDQVFIQVEG